MIPISARFGDNVTDRSPQHAVVSRARALLEYLESVEVERPRQPSGRSAFRCNGSTGPIAISAAFPGPVVAGSVAPGEPVV